MSIRSKRPARGSAGFNRAAIETLELRVLLTNVTGYHNDHASTGGNLTQTLLTPGNGKVSTFGKQFSTAVDGQAYAQPLYVAGIEITAVADSRDLHMLGYFIDVTAPELGPFLTRQRAERRRRVQAIAARLDQLGAPERVEQSEGIAAADEDRLQGGAGVSRHLFRQGGQVGVHQIRPVRERDEVAVIATLVAERDVNIKAGRRRHLTNRIRPKGK